MTKGDAGDSESHEDRNSPDSPFKKCHPDKIWNSDWISFLIYYFSYKNVSYHKKKLSVITCPCQEDQIYTA